MQALKVCIFLVVIFSWFPGSAQHPIVLFIRRVANPILRVAQKITPRIGMFDFSPIVAFLGIEIIISILVNILQQLH